MRRTEEARKIDRSLISKAIEETNRLKRKVSGGDTTREIRKWRESRRNK